MPAATKKSIKKRSNSKMNGGEGEESIKKFTSSRLPSPPPGITAANISAPKSASRLLTVPAAAAATAAAVAAASKPQGMNSVLRYVIIFIILGVLALGLYLYLEKPAGKSITHLFDPLFKNKQAQAPAQAKQAQAKQAQAKQAQAQAKQAPASKAAPSATETLQQTLDQKAIVNNIDRNSSGNTQRPKKFKSKPVVVPEAADAADTTKTPKSKAGFCYIGEDRGFRSCVDVGEGDVCMSGDIFPTEAICINPNLRE